MRRFLVVLVLISCVLALTSCGQQQTQTLPTLAPTQLPALPTDTSAPATEAPAQAPISRPTLPPTWTPSPPPATATVAVPTETPLVPPTAALQGLPTLVVCGTFREDRERNQAFFTFGTTPQVFWTAVDGAANYRVSLIDDVGTELFVDYTADVSYTFRADLFERGKRYGWEVYPRDTLGQQMCLERGAELFPQ